MLYGELPEVKIEGQEQPLRGFRFSVPNPAKQAILRLPTAEEMLARMDQQKSIRRTLGRRKSQTEQVPNLKADLDLFNQIRVDKDGIEFDEFEARAAIAKLTAIEATQCERAGGQFRLVLKTPFCETVHLVNIPTAKQLNEYRRTVLSSTELPHNQEELRFRAQSGVELYDAVAGKIEGYAAGVTPRDVPPHHKFAIAGELAQAVDDLDPAFDPNF